MARSAYSPCDLLVTFVFFFFNDTATTEIYTLSLHDALPISRGLRPGPRRAPRRAPASRPSRRGTPRPRRLRRGTRPGPRPDRSEEHTSELQSPCNLVCRLLLEKKKKSQTKVSYVSSSPQP